MKQTPVQFLHSEYKRIFGDFVIIPNQVMEMSDVFDKAKKMEEDEIKKAFYYGKVFSMNTAEDLTEDTYFIRYFKN
jgi:hypothetical protein